MTPPYRVRSTLIQLCDKSEFEGDSMKICFIGACGHSSQAYKYLKTRQDAEFAGFAPGSGYETKVPKFAENMPYFADYQRMLAEVKPDLAVVSPVFGLTASVILECAKRKIDVFSEKPVATTLEDLEKVEKAVTLRQTYGWKPEMNC